MLFERGGKSFLASERVVCYFKSFALQLARLQCHPVLADPAQLSLLDFITWLADMILLAKKRASAFPCLERGCPAPRGPFTHCERDESEHFHYRDGFI